MFNFFIFYKKCEEGASFLLFILKKLVKNPKDTHILGLHHVDLYRK